MMKDTFTVFAQNSILLKGDYQIYIDPFQVPFERHDADFVFITHPHWDHFSLVDILKIRNQDTIFLVPKEVFEELLDIGISEESILVVKPGKKYFFEGLSIKTIPAYNTNKEHHKKASSWVGYLIMMNQISYYIVGDSDVTEEAMEVMADVLFVPVGGTYTMNCEEAVLLANHIHPSIAVPTHYLTVVGSLFDALYFKEHLDSSIICKICYDTKEE